MTLVALTKCAHRTILATVPRGALRIRAGETWIPSTALIGDPRTYTVMTRIQVSPATMNRALPVQFFYDHRTLGNRMLEFFAVQFALID